MILLSIVVPVYCVEPWIRTCLLSIVTPEAFAESCELIIVDDGSPDKSVEIAQQACEGLSNVHIIRQPNQGLGAARNAGVALVKGRYLWFVDSDDWLTETGLSLVVKKLSHRDEIDVLNIDYIMSNGAHSKVINFAHTERVYSGVEYLSCSFVQNPVQYYIWSTSFYRQNSLMFESGLFHEDALFTPIALYLASRVRRLATDCYVYNLREGSIMNSGRYLKHALDMVTIVDRIESFRAIRACDGRGVLVLAKYSSLAVGGIYYYWKLLSAYEKIQLDCELQPLKLLRPVLLSGRLKYVFAILWMSLVRFKRVLLSV